MAIPLERAVIFDIGRVLVHWDPDAVLASLSDISHASLDQLLGLLEAVAIDAGRGSLGADELHSYLVQQAGTVSRWDQFYEAFCSGLCRDDDMLAYAAALHGRASVKIGVISNTNAVHVQWLHQQVPEFRAFDCVIMSCDVGLLKPDPAIYELALEWLSVSPRNAIFVDDMPENVAAAQALGMAGVLHRTRSETRRVIEAWLTSPPQPSTTRPG